MEMSEEELDYVYVAYLMLRNPSALPESRLNMVTTERTRKVLRDLLTKRGYNFGDSNVVPETR